MVFGVTMASGVAPLPFVPLPPPLPSSSSARAQNSTTHRTVVDLQIGRLFLVFHWVPLTIELLQLTTGSGPRTCYAMNRRHRLRAPDLRLPSRQSNRLFQVGKLFSHMDGSELLERGEKFVSLLWCSKRNGTEVSPRRVRMLVRGSRDHSREWMGGQRRACQWQAMEAR
ncbi:hypothetical protein OG21DRAFT_1005900 [Imleria badia]|nr:hypothetical protein OG21DRAFT_1005900 [Imleria badia]